MLLRPYQTKALADVRAAFAAGHRSVLLTSPVASGKTVMFSHVAAGVYQKKKRVLILAHRRELIMQISRTARAMNVPHATLLGGQMGLPRAQVLVAAVQTAFKRLRHIPAPDLIICDEAHRCCEDSAFGKIIKHFSQSRVLGVSASPRRTDLQPLSSIFDTLVHGPSVAELITMGYLPPPEVFAPAAPDLSGVHIRRGDYVTKEIDDIMSRPKITGQATAHYRKLAMGKRTIIFCCSVAHAEKVADEFKRDGFVAQHIDGKMDEYQRDKILRDFERGAIPIMTTVDLCNEGLDIPGIEAAILLRPTMSLVVHVQQCGRTMRSAPGKTKSIIIDAAGNCAKHGLPDEFHEWSLAGEVPSRGDADSVPRVSTCPVCFAAYRPQPVCPRCGAIPLVKSRKVDQVEGDLVQVAGVEQYAEADSAGELDRQFFILAALGRQRGYKDPAAWALRIVSAKLADRLAKERGLPSGTVNGLTEEESESLRRRTVMRAMSKEDAPVV